MTDQPTTALAPSDGDAVREVLRHAHALRDPEAIIGSDGEAAAQLYVVPTGYTVHTVDLTQYRPRPARKQGATKLADADSFIRFVQRHALPGTTLYAAEARGTITAVLNEDTHVPGWRDYTAELALAKTPEWIRWSQVSGQWQTQADFAEFVEDHLHVFETPSSAHMMELAQTFEAKTDVDFQSGARLDNGQRRITYKETIAAKAGQAGELEVPTKLRIGLIPFKGGPGFKLEAFLRFRITGGNLQLMVKLDRPEEVLENAFAATVERITDALDVPELMLVHSR